MVNILRNINWREILIPGYPIYTLLKEHFFGKKISILGQRETGKTTLLNYFMTGKITESYNATTGIGKIKKTSSKHLNEEGWDITLSNIQNDFSGVAGNYDSWIKAANEADILIYLFRLDHWFKNPSDIESSIEKDIIKLSKSLNIDEKNSDKKKKNIPIFIIGTHADLIERLPSPTIDRMPEDELFFKNIRARFKNIGIVNIHFFSINLRCQKDLSHLLRQMKEHME